LALRLYDQCAEQISHYNDPVEVIRTIIISSIIANQIESDASVMEEMRARPSELRQFDRDSCKTVHWRRAGSSLGKRF